MEILVVALLLAASLVPLVVPLFRPPLMALRSASGPAARLRALELRKSAIYGAIREVGFDLRTDKVEQDDYDRQVVVLKREAVEVVAEIEELKNTPPLASKQVERTIATLRKGAPVSREVSRGESPEAAGDLKRFCTQCGQAAAPDDRFCAKCGTALEAGA